ncbi:MAG: type I secretion system permease/ATPase [Gammaproteobacteria bacterium]|nr:type I secretion system permease/ATPase [Gammaproteobacteria bacterium]
MPYSVDREVADTGAVALAIVARLQGLAADPDNIRHQHARSGRLLSDRQLLRAAATLGFKAGLLDSDGSRLGNTPLPAMARHRDGHWFVIAALSAGKLLIHDPLEGRPLELPQKMVMEAWTGKLLILVPRPFAAARQRFDVSWFIPSLVKYRHLFAEVLVASCFIQLLALLTPLFFQVIMDKVLVHRGYTTLDVLAFGLLLVALFEVLLSGLRTYLFSHTTNRIDVELGARLFRHLLALPLSYFEARRVGDSVARIRELDRIREFLTGSALTLVIDLSFTLLFLVVMYWYSPILTWIVIGTIPVYVLLSMVITPLLRQRLNSRFERGAVNQAFLVETVSGIRTLKSLAAEPRMQQRWEDQLANYVAADFRARNLSNIAGQSASLINKIMMLGILWQGAHLVIAGELTVGQFIAFNMLAQRVSGPVLKIVQLWQDFQQAGLSIRRLGDILNVRPEPGYRAGRGSLPELQGRVTFDHVYFRYQANGREVLRGLSLDVRPGEIIGIVGSSGSGKSTLTKLIQRLYVPESGRVLVDGVDLSGVDSTWLRRCIGAVLQENELFLGSIRDNIAFCDMGAPMESVERAARLAGAHEFILQLQEGYDTQVGEQGVNLSGGQRQRISIARALMGDPRILIFDEATSALDYHSERLIQDNMSRIADGRTLFIIAHRLSSVRHADRIVVLENGCIVEQGSHEGLLREKGRYADLHAYQQGGPVRGEVS